MCRVRSASSSYPALDDTHDDLQVTVGKSQNVDVLHHVKVLLNSSAHNIPPYRHHLRTTTEHIAWLKGANPGFLPDVSDAAFELRTVVYIFKHQTKK